MTSYHAQCEHKPRHAEGPSFANLLEAVGAPDPNAGTNPSKRMRLSLRIREAAARAGSGTVLLFCDEAQRYDENEYEWLRNVHDALDRQQIKLFTFLVGQQELLARKTGLQIAAKTQIVARLMVEELSFHGTAVRNGPRTGYNRCRGSIDGRSRASISSGVTVVAQASFDASFRSMAPATSGKISAVNAIGASRRHASSPVGTHQNNGQTPVSKKFRQIDTFTAETLTLLRRSTRGQGAHEHRHLPTTARWALSD
jgi:hypothetical protein